MRTRNVLPLIVLLLIAITLGACSGAHVDDYWLVLYAFPQEGQVLRAEMTNAVNTSWAGRPVSIGTLNGQPVVLVESGMGMTNATLTVQHMADCHDLRGILFTGICGAIADTNKIGDLVIPRYWITHDFGYLGPDGLRTDSLQVGLAGDTTWSAMLRLPVDSQLFDWAEQAAYAAAGKFKPIIDRQVQVRTGGVGVTGNQFIDQIEKREWLHRQFDAEIVDMESAAVLQGALANGIPCVIIRSCSDLAGGSGSATAGTELREFFQVAADNSAAVVLTFMTMVDVEVFE